MSPGATFERVYYDLRRMLTQGELPPGSPIEPALIGREIGASITPVRDALHRLVGERLVEAPNHNGFRAPIPTEAGLRDLYSWNAQLLALAARRIRPAQPRHEASGIKHGQDAVAATEGLFVEIAQAASSIEHVRAVQQLNDRLAPFRRLEARMLSDIADELDSLVLHHRRGDRAQLVRLLDRHRHRRLKIVPAILLELHNPQNPAVH